MDVVCDIDAGKALTYAKEYLTGSWLTLPVENVSVRPLVGGFCSSLYLCEDKSRKCEPSQFLIRFLGGKLLDGEMIKFYNEGTESIVFFYHGHLGYGPKLYGSFAGGRLEEYIPSRNLTHDDLEHDHIRTQIARKLAKFHSMKLPVSKKPFPPLDGAAIGYKLFDNPSSRKEFADFSIDCGMDPNWINLIDLYAELDWLKLTLPIIGGRLVISCNDMNFMNFLIRDTPDKFGEIVTLIDYELGGTNWRGYDIGFHFASWQVDFNKDGFRSDKEYPDMATRRHFVTDYLDQARELNCDGSFDEDGLDSVDQVLMEAEFMSLYIVMVFYGFVLKPKTGNTIFADRKSARNFFNWGRFFVEFYLEEKKCFVDRYAAILKSGVVNGKGDTHIAAALS